MVPLVCRATIGEVGNGDHNLVNIGKAGRKRHMGIRPTVRGSVMNPNDHPHGGGEGKTSAIRSVTPMGQPALGLKTRKKNNVQQAHRKKTRWKALASQYWARQQNVSFIEKDLRRCKLAGKRLTL